MRFYHFCQLLPCVLYVFFFFFFRKQMHPESKAVTRVLFSFLFFKVYCLETMIPLNDASIRTSMYNRKIKIFENGSEP